MNITELARNLKVPTQELRDLLPQLGFDIGQKAIKVDDRTAQRIISQWPTLIKRLRTEQQQSAQAKEQTEQQPTKEKIQIAIPPFISVREFSQHINIPVNKILEELMKNSVFVSLNEKVDFETAAIIAADLGLELVPDEQDHSDQDDQPAEQLKQTISQEKTADLKPRPPVIVVMGHVDHGKTKLLDAIRQTNVVAGEAGGITQHIGAYQAARNNQTITFIDTPGHEAFTAMRSRGAKIADIAILVVAADDGVKPQTTEAFHIIKAAKIPFVVAINKIDKPDADAEKTKQELANQLKIMPEDWGGKTICVPISAKQNTGIEELLDMLLLTAELEAEHIKANPETRASGTVIESHIDKGEGPVATLLVQNGTLKIGDHLSYNHKLYGKVRALKDFRGQNVNQAPPSMPAKIIGLKLAPQVGDILRVSVGEKFKPKKIKSLSFKTEPTDDEDKPEDKKIKKINLIIKSDVLGSGEAIEETLAKINSAKVKVKIISKGLGNITEGDISRAEDSQAYIVGFNVKLPSPVEELAREKNIQVKLYNIIYELINDIKTRINELTEPDIKRVDLGKLKVLAIFKTSPAEQIVGGKITQGKVLSSCLVEVFRNQELTGQGVISELQIAKQQVSQAELGQECGLKFMGKPVIAKDDLLQFYTEEKVTTKI